MGTLRDKLRREVLRDGRHVGRHADDYMPDFSIKPSERKVVIPGVGNTRTLEAEHAYPTPSRHVLRGIPKPPTPSRPRLMGDQPTKPKPPREFTDAEVKAQERAYRQRRLMEIVSGQMAETDTWAHKS